MAPTLPVRSLGQQGLQASVQGLGTASVHLQSDPIHHSEHRSRKCARVQCQWFCHFAGCMGMSTAYKDKASPVTDEESIATIHKALELGVTFLDTSDMYGPFTNEELVGRYLQLQTEQLQFHLLHLSDHNKTAGPTVLVSHDQSPLDLLTHACMLLQAKL